MEIPAIYAAGREDGGLLAIAVDEGRCMPSRGAAAIPFQEAVGTLPRSDERLPAVVVDFESLVSRGFDERVVKGMRVRGRDVWFMTWIRDADDLMDAFNTTAEAVIAPFHSMEDEAAMEDILSMSDSVMPAVFMEKGRVVSRGRAPAYLRETLERLEGIGFRRPVVIDVDGSVPGGDWEWIADVMPSCVPFTGSPGRMSAYGFGTTVAPIRFRGPRRGTPSRVRRRPPRASYPSR